MSLDDEIKKASSKIFNDGYEMSLGEIISLYKADELIVNPEYQRYFRWEESQKTRFIESILLGIPIPPIFVFEQLNGTWELVDGLQRLSTIFEFIGNLKKGDGTFYAPSVLTGTKLLPTLNGKVWAAKKDDDPDAFTKSQQLIIKRARI